MNKHRLIYFLALMLAVSSHSVVAKGKKSVHHAPVSTSPETQIRNKYDEIEKIKSEMARVNSSMELQIKKKYEEIYKLKGEYDSGFGTMISYP